MSESIPTSDAPAAPSAFAGLGLDARLVDALVGYTTPTPIQKEAIPPLLAGRDLIGLAATGTGKTAAFALPLLHRIAAAGDRPMGRPPAALILVPTRELAIQVASAVTRYGKPLNIKVVAVYGGSPFGDQSRALRRGADVVVATPGRALDHLRRETLTLEGIQIAVLDEADEMLDMGFADDLEAILSAAPKERQTALFSATMPPRIVGVAEKHLRNPERVQVSAAPVPAGQAPKVRQQVIWVPREFKTAALARVLEFEGATSALVFCRTRDEADEVAQSLAQRGLKPEALHGGLAQDQRDRVMGRFRSEAVSILVATDVAARGLDISHLSHVVNYGVPTSPEVYVHRIGRVGRAGREGVALTVADPRERRLMASVERLTSRSITPAPVPTAEDVRGKRRAKLTAAVKATMTPAATAEFRAVVEELTANGSTPTDVAAAVLAFLASGHRSPDDELQIPQVTQPRGERTPGARPAMGRPGRNLARVFIGAGRQNGFGRREVLAAIENEVGLSSRDIGTITVSERFCVVEVPEVAVDEVISRLDGLRFRGRPVPARRDRATGPAAVGV